MSTRLKPERGPSQADVQAPAAAAAAAAQETRKNESALEASTSSRFRFLCLPSFGENYAAGKDCENLSAREGSSRGGRTVQLVVGRRTVGSGQGEADRKLLKVAATDLVPLKLRAKTATATFLNFRTVSAAIWQEGRVANCRQFRGKQSREQPRRHFFEKRTGRALSRKLKAPRVSKRAPRSMLFRTRRGRA